jgi:hypothetical protein
MVEVAALEAAEVEEQQAEEREEQDSVAEEETAVMERHRVDKQQLAEEAEMAVRRAMQPTANHQSRHCRSSLSPLMSQQEQRQRMNRLQDCW